MRETNKNILLLSTPFRPNVGGVETHLDDLIWEGQKKGFHFSVMTYQPLVTNAKGKTIEKGKGYFILRIPWIRLNLFLKLGKYPLMEFIYLFPGLFITSLIYLLINYSKISTIHAQGLVAGAVGVLLSKIFGKKIIISTHSIYSFPKKGLYKAFIRFIFKNCDHILALSNQSKSEIVNLGIEQKKVTVFTYWVNQKVFHPTGKSFARDKLKLPKNKFICLFVGRLVEGKGVDQLLKAMKVSNQNIYFVIVGDGPLASQVDNYEGDNLKFVGKVENAQLPFYYNCADILIVPSTHEEGYGRVILEAFSCGLPVIAANRGGIKESVSKKTGILIDISPKKINLALEKVLHKKNNLKEMSNAAFSFAKENFSSQNLDQIIRYYD